MPDGIAEITSQIKKKAPDLQPHIMDESEKKLNNSGDVKKTGVPIKGKTDKHGRIPNDEMHVKDSTGNWVVNKKDGYIRIKPGRTDLNTQLPGKTDEKINQSKVFKPGENVDTPINDSGPDILLNGKSEEEIEAENSANLLFGLGQLIFGAAGAPIKNNSIGLDEPLQMKLAFKNYYDAKGIVRLPPEIGLFMAVGQYVGFRLAMPEGKARIKMITGFFKKGRKDAQSDSRIDGERKNDTGKEVNKGSAE